MHMGPKRCAPLGTAKGGASPSEPPEPTARDRGEPNPDEASKAGAHSKSDSVGVTSIATR